MKKYLITVIAALACSFGAITTSSGQTANFIYNDGNGTPDAGSYTPGSSFTFSINLGFTPGGAILNLEGFSYWFQQNNASPFNFSITLRDITGSMFTDLQTPALTYPQSLAPSNVKDLGALLPGPTGIGAGTYFVANITISIDPSALPGVYTLQNVTSGGKTAFMFNDAGTGFAIPASAYTVTVLPVPEPGSIAFVVGGVGLLAANFIRRRRKA